MDSLAPVRRVSALAVLLSVVFALAGAISPAVAAPSASTINTGKQGSITIHKRTAPATGSGDGTEITPAPGEKISGATYKIHKVQADLSTNEGFATASALTAETAKVVDSWSGGDGMTQTTNGEGIAKFTSLPVGVYLVTETDAPEGYSTHEPFLVYVPTTNPEGSGWIYDVHVYPKDEKTITAEKKVIDKGKNAGEEITYEIRSTLPTPAKNGKISKYEVTDDVPEAVDVEASDIRVSVDGTTSGSALDSGDYTITPANGSVNKFTVKFTDSGRDKLSKAQLGDHAGGDEPKVVVVVTGTVKNETLGTVTNKATVIANNGSGGGEQTAETNTVQSMWAELRIQKNGKDNSGISGATFELYACTAGGETVGEKLSVSGKTQWTSNDKGKINIKGLQPTDFYNGSNTTVRQENGKDVKYCLVETKAPAGHELLSQPVVVDFTVSDLQDTNSGSSYKYKDVTIKNIAENAGKLPLTGAGGITLLVLLGIVLIGGGLFLARRNSKK